jgi:hypothetical protein
LRRAAQRCDHLIRGVLAGVLPDRSELHRLVDRLIPDQARAMRAVALQLVREDPQDSQELSAAAASEPAGRRLSFAGIGHAGPDLAEASQDILRGDLARMAELVRTDADFPLGAADASVIEIAERLDVTRVATIDHRHFR